jgi:hypothetical protein
MQRFALAVLVLAASAASAQQPSAAHKAEMKKLDYLVGKWKGEATLFRGKETTRLTQTEDVQYRLGGVVMLIEGTGRGKLPGKDEDGVVFNALAVVSYDAQAKKHMIKAHRMEGNSVDAEMTLTEKGFIWGFTTPDRKVQTRYTMTLTEKGEWHEVGEYSLDSKTWTKFIEMTLTRVKE